MRLWSKGRKLWSGEKDDIVDNLINDIDKEIKFKSYEEKCKVEEIIDGYLRDSAMYKHEEYESKTKLMYRILFILWIPCQLLLIPYCAFRWLIGKGWYLDNDSKLTHLIRKIDQNS